MILNIFIPKHSILLWAAGLIVVNHYYDSKATIVAFVSIAIMMLIALYLSLILGEWDANLFNGAKEVLINGELVDVEEASISQRIDWLNQLKDSGDNRYLKVFTFYYIPRVLELGIIAFICYTLSNRSFKLLVNEETQASQNATLSNELKVASNIQNALLPKEFVKTLSEDAYGLMNPAKEVGCDYYDYFYVDKTHLAIVISDVSGKGIPSALFMMRTATLIKSLTTTYKSVMN